MYVSYQRLIGAGYTHAERSSCVLKHAPLWIKDLSWQELDSFFMNTFRATDRKHHRKYDKCATADSIYDYVNMRWTDRHN